ncbi:polymer-forming cytoskeletal protein [Janthinobacterium agaricidamnosum]|nr:polymer-forming cytoskeletal protein [Janthinobacterium agaricidamnosum]
MLLAITGLAEAGNLNFNGATVSKCALSGKQYTCSAFDLPNFNDGITIASGYTVTVPGNIALGFNNGLTMSGTAALVVNGDLDIRNISTSLLNVSGGSLSAKGGTFSMGGQAQTIVANISGAVLHIGDGSTTNVTGTLTSDGAIDIASNVTINGPLSGSTVRTSSPVTINGDVSASTSFNLASGGRLTGKLVAPLVSIEASGTQVTGDIVASTSITVGSGNTVKGNLTSPTVQLDSSNVVVNGNVTASKSLNLGSSGNISGNVIGGAVELQSSDATIAGNARVDSIILGWHGRVQQKITCNISTPANPCRCVSNNSGYDAGTTQGPVCSPGTLPPSAVDHYQITHGGTALTCSPQTVTVTACANSSCSSTYTNGATVVMTPGNQPFTIGASGVTTVATVQQSTPGVSNLSLSGTPAQSGALVCRNSVTGSNSCAMVFSNTGLEISVPPQFAEKATAFTIKALKDPGGGQSCVPLFASSSKNINLKCGYDNPSSGTLPVRIASQIAAANGSYLPLAGNAASACGSSGASVSLAFDANGIAQPAMLYADAGRVSLSAAYTAPGADANTAVIGSGLAIVAPASFAFGGLNQTLRAGAALPATLSALNSAGAATPNFGAETAPQTVQVLKTYVEPVFGTGKTAGVNPGLSGGFDNFIKGVAAANGLAWGEVGKISLQASLNNPNGYLDSGLKPLGDSGGLVFIPDHFDSAIIANFLNDGFPGDCQTAWLPCAGAAKGSTGVKGVFVYSAKNFGVSVLARNAQGVTTQNYSGKETVNANYAKDSVLEAWDAASGKNKNPPAAPANNTLNNAVIPLASFNNGEARVSVNYQFANAYAAAGNSGQLAAPTDILLRARQADGNVTSLRNPPSATVEGQLTVLSGRAMVQHSYGSELLPMKIKVFAQYWSAAGAWSNNVSDSITVLPPAALVLANCKKNLAADSKATCKAALSVKNSNAQFSNGVGIFGLNPPGTGNNGSVEVSVTNTPYLPGTVGRTVFGVLRSEPVIYVREAY